MIYEVRTYTLKPGSVAQFEENFGKAPSTIVIDDSGFIYVGDIEGRRVQKFDDRGNFQWEAATTVPDGG